MLYFYPRPPRGGRRGHQLKASIFQRFLSTPSARRATQLPNGSGKHPSDFYPRPPRGGRQADLYREKYGAEFLSTPSARRATGDLHPVPYWQDISIHALREEGDPGSYYKPADELLISIHALREEGDRAAIMQILHPGQFLSTPSARRATISPRFGAIPLQFLSTPSARRATCRDGAV